MGEGAAAAPLETRAEAPQTVKKGTVSDAVASLLGVYAEKCDPCVREAPACPCSHSGARGGQDLETKKM